MTNFKRTKNLLTQAKVIQREAQNELEQGFWNLCIRRSQEAVELALKGLLVSIGVEYPKSHDVGHVLGSALRKKKIEAPSREISEIIKISKGLAKRRAPAFY